MDEYDFNNLKKSITKDIEELKGRIAQDGYEGGHCWTFYIVKYLPIPLARKVILLSGFITCQVKVLWYGKERYEIMINKEIAKIRQIETQMLKDEKKNEVSRGH